MGLLPCSGAERQICTLSAQGFNLATLRLTSPTLRSNHLLHERPAYYEIAVRSQGKLLASTKRILFLKNQSIINAIYNYTWLMILLVYLACPALHIIAAVRIREKGLSLHQRVPNHKHQCLS